MDKALELADLLEVDSWYKLVTREEITTMLRQQQAEYYSLLVNHDKLYTKVVEQQTKIEALKAENKFFKDLMGDVEILRKAQENG